jgi:heat shock protein HtpX
MPAVAGARGGASWRKSALPRPLALSRSGADLEAAELTGDPYGLAAALVKMRERERMFLRRWSPPIVPLPSLFRDHPATDEPIRRLMALAPRADASPTEGSTQLLGRAIASPARGGDAS